MSEPERKVFGFGQQKSAKSEVVSPKSVEYTVSGLVSPKMKRCTLRTSD
ncbi:MAG: hypothetical protein IPL27_00680 [Lewinellaceae bacterium]|nr:hypothetical protein [Lewinellaceae bacterium]